MSRPYRVVHVKKGKDVISRASHQLPQNQKQMPGKDMPFYAPSVQELTKQKMTPAIYKGRPCKVKTNVGGSERSRDAPAPEGEKLQPQKRKEPPPTSAEGGSAGAVEKRQRPPQSEEQREYFKHNTQITTHRWPNFKHNTQITLAKACKTGSRHGRGRSLKLDPTLLIQ